MLYLARTIYGLMAQVIVTSAAASGLLLETGDDLLLESGHRLLLE